MKIEIDYVISTTKHIIQDISVLNAFKISNDNRLVRKNVIIIIKDKEPNKEEHHGSEKTKLQR